MNAIQKEFEAIGGQFCTKQEELKERLRLVKAFVFDWDGVFNNAEKAGGGGSHFNEADSMGTNLLRFAYYLQFHQLPITAIISGEHNQTAFYFSERECFHASYYKTGDKNIPFAHFCEQNGLKPHEVAYVFDDVLDLSIALQCGLRLMVSRKANPLFANYVRKNQLADYMTGCNSGDSAVREVCELLMGTYDIYDRVLHERTLYSEVYKDYINLRKAVKTRFYTKDDDGIIEARPQKV